MKIVYLNNDQNMLTIEAYDRAENRARALLSMREAQAFAPATFGDQFLIGIDCVGAPFDNPK